MFKKELYFKCKKLKHKARDYCEDIKVHEIVANSKNDILSLK